MEFDELCRKDRAGSKNGRRKVHDIDAVIVRIVRVCISNIAYTHTHTHTCDPIRSHSPASAEGIQRFHSPDFLAAVMRPSRRG
jgi:hypothetical protein